VTLPLRDGEHAGLSAYLQRVLGLDDRAAVRVQAAGEVVGVWSGPPFGVLALRPAALREAWSLDVTVSARRLFEALPDSGDVPLPTSVVGPAWAALLPPRSGWDTRVVVPVQVVRDQVGVGVEAFRRRVEALAPPLRTPEALERAAEEVWGAASVADLPLRVAHAAENLGFLGPDGDVRASAAGAWRRLGCPGGSVVWTARPPAGSLLGLDVLGLSGP
jgi:hypothetical protein